MEIREIALASRIRAAWTADGTPDGLAGALNARSHLFPKQVHGIRVDRVGAPDAYGLEADGLLTDAPGLLVGVRTADCLPILIAHRDRPFVGAVHAGWRGLAVGILDRLAERIAEGGWRTADCAAFVGPAIGPCCYEVGSEVGERFGRHFDGKTLDLKGFAAERLSVLGFGEVRDEGLCTHCTATLHSYRRDPRCGRILTGIVIQNDNGCHLKG
jgi:YfiH family protein